MARRMLCQKVLRGPVAVAWEWLWCGRSWSDCESDFVVVSDFAAGFVESAWSSALSDLSELALAAVVVVVVAPAAAGVVD